MTDPAPWLIVIDAQHIFADPASDWGSPLWGDALANIELLLPAFAGRTVLTRWIPPSAEARVGSWADYMAAWPFADRAVHDPYLELVDELGRVNAPVIDAATFGKWDALRALLGEAPSLVVTGVATDCCVVSTVLAAADAGARITVVTDACAGSSPENHAAACTVMGLYPPQVVLASTTEVLAASSGAGER